MSARPKTNQKGFTIVELMIALAVLSSLLLMSSLLLINLGHLFSKGTNQANTQNTARNIMNDLATQIELGSATPVSYPPTFPPNGSLNPGTEAPSSGTGLVNGSQGVICIGAQRYTYVLNHVLTTSSTDHVLWRDTMVNANSCEPVDDFVDKSIPSTPLGEEGTSVPGSGSELMSPGMRLTDFSVNHTGGAPGTYTIKVTVAFGGSESDGSQDLVSYSYNSDPAQTTTSCATVTGDEFCATSSLTETVVQRLIQQN